LEKQQTSRFHEEVKTIAIAIGIALFIRAFIIEPYEIPSGSMIPTLHIGDHILVRKFEYGIHIPFTRKYLLWWKDPERGDVIVFLYPGNPSKNFVKRVIGLPGDTVEIKNKQVYINGKPLYDLYGFYTDKEAIPFRDRWGPHRIPEGYFFVMGDNRDFSNDSRMWASDVGLEFDPSISLVPRGNVKGKAWSIYWSVRENHSYQRGKVGLAARIGRFFKSIIDYFGRIDWSRIGRKIYMN